MMVDVEIRLPDFTNQPDLPRLNEDEYTFQVTAWRAKEGENIQQGQDLFRIETEDILLDVSSPLTGCLKTVVAQVGHIVQKGDLLAIFEVVEQEVSSEAAS